MKQSEVQGIVIRSYDYGETDQIIVLHTSDRGIVRAIAKGIRRPGSRFGGRLQLHCLATVELYAGRNLDIITGADLIFAFEGIRTNWQRSICAAVIAQAVGGVVQEDNPSISTFMLHQDVLQLLHHQPTNPIALMTAFLLRLAHLEGYTPAITRCAVCNATDITGFAVLKGGVTCTAHTTDMHAHMNPETWSYLRVLAGGKLEDIANLAVDPVVINHGRRLVERWFGEHLTVSMSALESLPR